MIFIFLQIVNNGDLKELFSTGKNLDPSIAKLSSEELAVTRDNMSVLINTQGSAIHK